MFVTEKSITAVLEAAGMLFPKREDILEIRSKVNKMKDKDYPIVLTEDRDDGVEGQMFWCPFCKKYHYHGEGDGHRTAHCDNPNSPWLDTGYIVKKK